MRNRLLAVVIVLTVAALLVPAVAAYPGIELKNLRFTRHGQDIGRLVWRVRFDSPPEGAGYVLYNVTGQVACRYVGTDTPGPTACPMCTCEPTKKGEQCTCSFDWDGWQMYLFRRPWEGHSCEINLAWEKAGIAYLLGTYTKNCGQNKGGGQ